MIPTIGIMVGFYIIARCVAMSEEHKGKTVVQVVSALAALVSIVGIIVLLTSRGGL